MLLTKLGVVTDYLTVDMVFLRLIVLINQHHTLIRVF